MSTQEPKSFNSQEVDSLLKYVKIQNIENISKNVFLISSKNSILKRTKVILEQYKEKPRIQTNIYTNISLIKYSKDGNLINSLEKMNDKELEKCTYVSKYGLQGAKKILEEITKEAIEELKEYGDRAEFLRELALYIKDRNK